MRRSKVEIYLHFVWTTWRREPTLIPEIETAIYRFIEQEATRMGCSVLAIGGIPDHVHLALKIPATVSVAELMKQIKGGSSAFGRKNFTNLGFAGWQDNYGVLSFGARERKSVLRYIANQKHHHANNDLWPETEEANDEVEPVQNSA